ncbi:MAG: carbamoyltransferase HypF [Nitrospina sp.]|jgi:hydrogenase maturation protein HypF|nr:carbamoyltransferase HypF [Nitrospina sp.]
MNLPVQVSSCFQGERIHVRGLVQGVGFRPAVWHFAHECGLTGDVLNDGEGVLIRVWGTSQQLDKFVSFITHKAPTLARIDSIERILVDEPGPLDDFTIVESDNRSAQTGIAPDIATCPDCLEESLSSFDRRYRYPFTNCSHCGPRLSIVSAIPYDRAHTSMTAFEICDVCKEEYLNPHDRRFHAQPIACHTCGPKIWLERSDRCTFSLDAITQLDEVDGACTLLQQGEIIAIKSIGGFHLACDATNKEAVEKLRYRKQRYGKPLALMAKNLEIIEQYCRVSGLEKSLLESPAAPIVLLAALGEKRLPEIVAPGMTTYGFMLPGTPLHHLILKRMNRPIVFTSGNLSEEPQCIDNAEAQDRLKDIADYFLLHNRDIVNRVDDSVVRVMGEKAQLLRRGRGYAPDTFNLPPGFENAPPLLALGGQLKNTFCLVKNGKAFLSQHMGDMNNSAAFDDYKKNITLYKKLFQHKPQALVVDVHPDYLPTKFGREWAEREGMPILAVQHHHAHIVACMAENNIPLNTSPVLGVALDGLGYGEDESLWGGEFLLADYLGFKRLGNFKPIPLLGGSQAMREPWRNTLAHILTTFAWSKFIAQYGDLELAKFLQTKPVDTYHSMIKEKFQCPDSSSAGRLFDAVAAAIGVCRERATYEGQAAMELEALVDGETLSCNIESGYPFTIVGPSKENLSLTVDPQGMWKGLLADLKAGTPKSTISARFHIGLASVVTEMTQKISEANRSVDTVALTGGVFQNKVLLEQVTKRLQKENFTVLTHARIPSNDGGISLGQAMVAVAHCIGEESLLCV